MVAAELLLNRSRFMSCKSAQMRPCQIRCLWMQTTLISVCDQPCRSTQPGHPFVGQHSEYHPKGGDALRLGNKGRYGSCGWQVELCDPLVTLGPYLSALAVVLPIIRCFTNHQITPTLTNSGQQTVQSTCVCKIGRLTPCRTQLAGNYGDYYVPN